MLFYCFTVLLAILGVTAGLFAYLLLADIIVALIGNERDGSFYLYRGIALLACLSLKEVFAVFSTSVSHKATFQSLKEIREELSAKLFHMPLGNIMNIPSGKLKNIIVDQVDSMETTMAHIIPEMTANILGPIVLFVYMLILDWRLALVSLIPLLIGMFCMKSVMATYGKNYQKSVEINQGMNNAVVEYINGIEVIKTFNQSDASYKKYSDAVYDNSVSYYGWLKEIILGVTARYLLQHEWNSADYLLYYDHHSFFWND